MKLPNGFGSIACYSGNRRRPYIVRKYIDGRQKIIGQYATYEDALLPLSIAMSCTHARLQNWRYPTCRA